MTTRRNIPTWSRPYSNIRLTNGPVRVKDESPPEGWEPRPFMGFSYREEKSDDAKS